MRHFELDLREGFEGAAKGPGRRSGDRAALSACLFDAARAVRPIRDGAAGWRVARRTGLFFSRLEETLPGSPCPIATDADGGRPCSTPRK